MSPDTNTDPQSVVDEDPHTASDSLVFGKWPGPSDILKNFDDEVDDGIDDEPVNPRGQWGGLLAAESNSQDDQTGADQTQWRADTGATTAEYAITTLATVELKKRT